jgi:hypothetical protein
VPRDASPAPAYLVAANPPTAKAPAHDHGPHRAQPQQPSLEGAARRVDVNEPQPTPPHPEDSSASDAPRAATHTPSPLPTHSDAGAADSDAPRRPADPAFQLSATPRRPAHEPVTREAEPKVETEIPFAQGLHSDVERPSGGEPSPDHVDRLVAGDELGEGL